MNTLLSLSSRTAFLFFENRSGSVGSGCFHLKRVLLTGLAVIHIDVCITAVFLFCIFQVSIPWKKGFLGPTDEGNWSSIVCDYFNLHQS